MLLHRPRCLWRLLTNWLFLSRNLHLDTTLIILNDFAREHIFEEVIRQLLTRKLLNKLLFHELHDLGLRPNNLIYVLNIRHQHLSIVRLARHRVVHINGHLHVSTAEVNDVLETLILAKDLPLAQQEPPDSLLQYTFLLGIYSLLRQLNVLLILYRDFGTCASYRLIVTVALNGEDLLLIRILKLQKLPHYHSIGSHTRLRSAFRLTVALPALHGRAQCRHILLGALRRNRRRLQFFVLGFEGEVTVENYVELWLVLVVDQGALVGHGIVAESAGISRVGLGLPLSVREAFVVNFG